MRSGRLLFRLDGPAVERWLDLITWSTAKKTAFAMSVALVFHLIVPPFSLLAFAWWSPGLVDLRLLTKAFAAWALVVAAIIAVTLPVARRGGEGRWTFYILLFAYGGSLMVVLIQFGLAASPWFAVLPLIQEAVKLVASAPACSAPCSAPAAPASLCISTTSGTVPQRFVRPCALQASACSPIGEAGVIG